MKSIIKISLTISSILLSFNGYTQETKQAGNGTASCDSTCMTNAVQSSQSSNLQQRVIACVSGFTGTRLQTRVKNNDGTWSEWTDKNIDSCTCAPTSKTQSVVCEEPLKGTKTEKSNWTCTTPKAGVWSNWTTESSNCYTACAPLADESRTVSCGSGYSGTMTQTRTSSCSGDDSKPPTWSSWNTVSSNCVAKPVCTPQFTGTFGPSQTCHSVAIDVPDPMGIYYGPNGTTYSKVWKQVCQPDPNFTTCP